MSFKNKNMKRIKIKSADSKTIKQMQSQIQAHNYTISSLSVKSSELNKKMFQIASGNKKELVVDAIINYDATELISFENEEDKLLYYTKQLKESLVKCVKYNLVAKVRELEKLILE